VGGGLSGLAVADALHRAGVSFQLFEARDRFGGRIETVRTGQAAFDLGPSWYWPGQPRITALINDLGLSSFDQFGAGDAVFEEANGTRRRLPGLASMVGAFRLDGGMGRLVAGLAARLPADRLHAKATVRDVDPGGRITLEDGRVCLARDVVLAVPPRLVSRRKLAPQLSPRATQDLARIPTWMAGQAKLVAAYDRPFWRALGLSGDAISHIGPLAEIHDASGPSGSSAALFGFVGVPAAHREGRNADVIKAATEQLARLFGEEAGQPNTVMLRDWAVDRFAADPSDKIPQRHHPTYGVPDSFAAEAGGRLHLAGTENDVAMGGLMEGALSAAARVSNGILDAHEAQKRATRPADMI